jgi:hypothetical protein
MRLALRIVGAAGYVVAVLAAVLLTLASYLASQSLAFEDGARETQGRVIGYAETPSTGGTRYAPRVAFVAADGRQVEFRGQMIATLKRFEIGASVPVRYLANKPETARINLFADNWLGATIAFVLGAIAAVLALVVIYSARRQLAD